MATSDRIKYLTNKFESVGTVSHSLYITIKYNGIFCKYFTRNFDSFESKHLYEAIIILIYYFLIVTNIRLSAIECN